MPFRVYVADCSTRDVTDARETLLSHVFFNIGFSPNEDGLCQESVAIQPRQITRIEAMDP